MRPFLQGQRIYLRPVEPATDISLIATWLNDPVVTKYMVYGQTPMTVAQVEKLIMDQVSSPNHAQFMICDNTTKKPIGFAGLHDLQFTAHKALYRILIGETDFWGKGYGTEVTQLISYYGFDRLNLNRINLGVTSENIGAIKAYEKAGYIREGVFRDDVYRNSQYYDTIYMSLLREEYYQKHYEEHKKMFSVEFT